MTTPIEKVQEALEDIRQSGFKSYNGKRPCEIAVEVIDMLKDHAIVPVAANPYHVMDAAMQAGFMVSSGYGQEIGKIMPVSDAETLADFHQAMIAPYVKGE